MNESFAYLAVMISIVLGLAAAHVLGSVARVINNRDKLVMYWPSLLWAATLFLLVAQLWWADASLRTYSAWSFGAFLVLLAQPAALYLLCALNLPVPDDASAFDMHAAFMQNRSWFLGVLLVLIGLSFVKDFVLFGRVPLNANFGALLIFAILVAGALRYRSELVQKINAVVAAILTVAYIVVLFSALPA
jgi:hypothetical protein